MHHLGCASGLHAIGTAYTDIKLGRSAAAVCGGVESTVTPLAVAGFNALKALSTRNDDPTKASRPFDADRDGFVIGEGCGLLLLESLTHARRGVPASWPEVAGFGASGDAYHMTAPPEDGEGMALAMAAAIREAGLTPAEVAHINAHGTSTALNDACETKAIKTVLGEHARNVPITANKSMIGHCLGAAGGIESVVSVKTMVEGVIPPTINQDNPDPGCDLDYTQTPPATSAWTTSCAIRSDSAAPTPACSTRPSPNRAGPGRPPGHAFRQRGDARNRVSPEPFARIRSMEELLIADPEVGRAVCLEIERQTGKLEMIASENFVSTAVRQAQGSVLTHKYAEGYPGKRLTTAAANTWTSPRIWPATG